MKKQLITIILISSLMLFSCTEVQELIAGEPDWTDGKTFPDTEGAHYVVGTTDETDRLRTVEAALNDAGKRLNEWARLGIDTIVDSYLRKAGDRALPEYSGQFLEYAPGYVPAWVSGAFEKDLWINDDGSASMLLELDLSRMEKEVKSFADLLLLRLVPDVDKRMIQRSFIMEAIDDFLWGAKE